MIELNPLIVVLAIHFGIILIYFVIFIITGKTNFRRENIIPIVAIPIFGLLIGLGIQLVHWAGRSSKKPVSMETMHLGSDIYLQSLQKAQENLDIVPLEEAIHLDSYGIRRRILLDVLFDEPAKHLQVLMVARHNEDPETAHYAATTIEKIQRDYQMETQRYSAYLKLYANDQKILNDYIRLLGKYIKSGLLEDHMAIRQRKVLSKLLDLKLSQNPNDKQTLVKKLKNNLALNEYASCLEISKLLRLSWPGDEDTWIESLRVCVEGRDQKMFKEVLDGIQGSEIDWSKSGREQLKYWIEGFNF